MLLVDLDARLGPVMEELWVPFSRDGDGDYEAYIEG